MSTNYRSMIDEALASARSRLTAEVPQMTKSASSTTEDSLVKEASDLADALEYISHSVGTGNKADQVKSAMLSDFFSKSAADGPVVSETSAKGTQEQTSEGGKAKLNPKGLVSGDSPAQSSASPEARDGEKTLRESMKQAESLSLYDILMSSKEAGQGGPAEMSASEDAPGIPTGNENAGRQDLLGTNEAAVAATKRQAKLPTRARLQEIFSHAQDTTGEQDAAAVFPMATRAGTIKVSSVMDKLANIEKARKLMESDGLSAAEALGKVYPDWDKEKIAATAAKMGG